MIDQLIDELYEAKQTVQALEDKIAHAIDFLHFYLDEETIMKAFEETNDSEIAEVNFKETT